MLDASRLMTPDEVCALLGLPGRSTLYAQRYRGDPPGCLGVLVGRHLRWDPADLQAWLDELKADRRTQSGASSLAQTNRRADGSVR